MLALKLSRLLFTSCCLAVMLAGGAGGARAQTLYDVEGIVYGPDRRPLQNVAVFLEDQTRSRVNQTITNNDGRYRFSRVTAGTYYVVVSPNDKLLETTVQRVELINTASAGSNFAVERADINVMPAAHAASAPPPATVFAQAVPPEAEKEYAGAMESLAKRDKVQAVGQLKRALEIFPDYFLALQQLGLFYVEEGKYDEAVAPLQKALKVNPKAVQSLVALGIAYVNAGLPELAAETLGRALALDPHSFQGHFYLGIALLNLERLGEAERALKKAYELGGAGRAASAHLYLASIYSKRKQYRQAVDELEKYLRDNPQAKNAASVRQAIQQLKAKL